ncbi:Telomere-associated protein RIF1 [Harpegnathos saltator]|uniref:Telomere-associated protein RIF1 n=1 Tax=Harpegnathos saltator TaxID=610380 RepID=E2B8N1_HARSA|nr:Telomere-associated protein RIF1 [Harpegnathos saltator]
MTTFFSKMLKTLRENSGVKEKREALTYISSQAKKLELSGVIKEDRYKELCRLVIESFTKEEGMQYEALGALTAIVQEFQAHSLCLFESILRTNKKIRLKILKLLEVVEDNAISAAANDGQALNFFKDCMISVQPNLMEWITPTACIDNLQILTKVEHHVLSDEQKLEEDTITYSLTLLKRLYRLAAVTFDQNMEKFDTLLMDKVVTLAYMGHKRQRGIALKVMQQAIATNSSLRICKEYPELWAQYKSNLQSVYCKRMFLLVAACETDWSIQWNITIQLLGADLHRGANLINSLLSVEEKAFKSTDTIIRRQAFLSWKLLIDNFALDYQELATARRIKLLCIPLNAKNSKTELIALTKLEVWWHLIIKLYKDIAQFVTPVITQFLNFCFGPLGDTPLLSSKFDVIGSPGKRFLKTKLVAMDALYQLVVSREENSTVCASMLEERLPHAISYTVFQECSKTITHSIGEALLILGQLVDQEMKNRYQFGKMLWTSLIAYIKNVDLEKKDHLYRDVILIIIELGNHFDKPMVKDMIFNVVLPDLVQIVKTTEFIDSALSELVLKVLSLPVLHEVPEIFYPTFYVELWAIITKTLTKYIINSNKINEGDKNIHNFKTVKSVLSFPFQYIVLENSQTQNQAMIWRALYNEFEKQSALISTVKPNEIVLDVTSIMQTYLNTNNYFFILICLDGVLSTINYKHLLTQDGIPSIMQLTIDVTIIALNNQQSYNCEIALKILSSMLVTICGHNPHKVVLYLDACKSAIELALKSQLRTLNTEIENTWQTVISIFRGLDNSFWKLSTLYKETFIIAMNHPNSHIRSLTPSILGIKEGFDNTAKHNLDEIEKIANKSPSYSKRDSVTKKTEEMGKAKEVHVVGSFLNRKSINTKPIPSKSLEKDNKKTLLLPDPDSQDYVYIKTDLKFDINRLTEHQKETLKKKREDIPALYNDLSQSSSQNSQNLQEWFDMKAKHINESDKSSNKKSDFVQKPINSDANKENKIIVMQSELNLMDKMINNNNSNKLDGNVGDNIVDTKQKKDSVKEAEKKDSGSHDENTSKETKMTSSSFAGFNVIDDDDTNVAHSTISVAKKLNFESKEEFPADKMHERQSSPSMFDSAKRRYRNDKIDMTRSNSSLKSDETDERQKDSSITNIVQKTLKNNKEKPSTSISQKPRDDSDITEDSNKKGIKRKYVSDTESDGGTQFRRKRKMIKYSKDINDDDKDKSRDSDSTSLDTADMDGLTQRMKNEMSRLKIDMVFDCPAVNRRRLKHLDEGDKETALKRTWAPDEKGLKLKFLEAKSAEASKKVLKTTEKNIKDTKDGKEGNDTSQGVVKKRGRRSIRQDPDKNDSDVTKETKNSNDIDKVSPSKNSADIDTTCVVLTSQVEQDISGRIEDERLDKNDSKSISNKNKESSMVPETKELSQDEVEDVVESSQSPNVDIKLSKKCGEKQCFIKINKITNIHAVKASDVIVEKNYVPDSIPVDSGDNNVPDPCEQLSEVDIDNNKEINDVENKDDTCEDAIQETDNSNTKILVVEGQKTTDSSLSIKPTGTTSFSSPKGSSKVFSKLKSFTAHGRAAHMLGLVTKQSRIEAGSSIIEDDSSVKKSRTKDVESETLASKKVSTVKETDKIGGPSGSRQEKIFNNMRSNDYCVSSSTYMFTNLKNDGEKLSSKMDKNTSDSVSTNSSVDKSNEENTSLLCEKDDLPILEWSSANPPSLTASPSASILKRYRSTVSEQDSDQITPNKRKRVSFADPPVSKEMGYETSITDSPHKSTKFSMARSLTPKKDSPLKYKQLRLISHKLISSETNLTTDLTTENDVSNESRAESALETEEVNEPLIKTSEAYTDDVDEQISNSSSENNSIAQGNSDMETDIVDNLEQEVEITVDVLSICVPEDEDQDQQFLSHKVVQNTVPIDRVETGDSETQQDIFDGSDTKNNGSMIQTSNDEVTMPIQNNLADSIKLNVTNDSVINALPVTGDNLEDTVDIQNVTGLNSTVNSDEVFCEKLSRSSTYMNAKNVADQDTLPVTDSIFASLPSSQDSRCEDQNNVELDPEFLDSIQPIYPKLSSCREPIDTVIDLLTTPLWKQNLHTYLTSRNLLTIGDLAQLSEREINRIPLKGKPKTEFIRKVLKHYESTSGSVCRKENVPTLKYMSREKSLDNPPNQARNVLVRPLFDSIEAASTSINNESLSCSTPLTRPTEKLLDNLSTEKSLTEHLDRTSSMSSDICSTDISTEHENADILTSDAFIVNEKTNTKAPITVHSSPGISTSPNKSTILPIATSSSISKNLTTMTEVPSSNNSINVSAIVCDEPVITHTSIGVGTDEVYSSEPAVNKTTRSVESQMTLEDLLDEIDINVVLESAVRRCNPETILSQYKIKMRHLSEPDLVKETIRMLGLQNKRQLNDSLLKSICHSYGINNVLLRLPDIFNSDSKFFDRVFKAYYKKLDIVECLQVFNSNKLKNAICQQCTSSELVEMLSEKLKQEEQEGIRKPIPEISSLNAMLQRLPKDVIISHTVANEDIIPASVVLDIALQNNSSEDIARALSAQSPSRLKSVLDQFLPPQSSIACVRNADKSKEDLFDTFKNVCSKLTMQELLDLYHEAMTNKLLVKEEIN